MITPLYIAMMILIQVESSGGVDLYNKKEQAYGILQIRSRCLRDVNKHYGTNYTLWDCYKSPLISKWVYVHYIRMYNVNENSIEDICRFWNAGPPYKRLSKRAQAINDNHWNRCKEVYRGFLTRQRV
jgi:hypothetical protein